MTTPNESTAVAIRDSLIGRELAINVRAEPPVYRAGEIELLANPDLTAEVLNVPLDEYYQSLPAILGEDWYTDMNNLDRVGIGASAESFRRDLGDGEQDVFNTLDLLILYVRPHRAAYGAPWRAGATDFPICGSLTRLQGWGQPGGDCKTCQFNQFGSAEKVKEGTDGEIINGTGKRCAERTWIFALECINLATQEFAPMPILIDFPQGSDTAIRDYVNILARPGKGKSRLNTWDVITRVSLRPKANGGMGKQFAGRPVAVLDSSQPEYIEMVKDYQGMFREMALNWMRGFAQRQQPSHGHHAYVEEGDGLYDVDC